MHAIRFQALLESSFDRISRVLGNKAREYSSKDDRLKNFRKAAELQDRTMSEALGGMMAKHTVSIYDMIASGETYPPDVWDEKIFDHINYLILLRAIVTEQHEADPGF